MEDTKWFLSVKTLNQVLKHVSLVWKKSFELYLWGFFFSFLPDTVMHDRLVNVDLRVWLVRHCKNLVWL